MTSRKNSLWLKLWQPFFNLSIYGKFSVVLASFLFGFILVGIHNLYFINDLKHQLALLYTGNGADIASRTIQNADRYLRNGALLVTMLMLLLSLTSFLCIRILANLLDEMNLKLRELRINGGDIQGGHTNASIPILSHDEIGKIAVTVNGLISDIHDLSLFRRTIEADETTEDVYKRLAHVFRKKLNLPGFVIWEVDEIGEEIKPVYIWPQDMETEMCTMSNANICRAKRTGDIVSSIGYPGLCPVFPLADEMTHTCVPMMAGGRILGVTQFLSLFVNNEERQENLSINLQRGRQYLREALPVLHAKRLAENLHEMATRDTLTGLYNRRFLESNINTLIAGIKRRDSHMAVLMCDMDFFKKVNDEQGHEAGDLVLQGLSHTLRNCCRESDMVIRYGGEEFLILLVDCAPEEAVKVAEKIRSTVEEQQFRIEGIILKKTLSIGVSQFPEDTAAFWECVKYADIALYQAKETGRNRVIRFSPEMWNSSDY